MTIIAEPEPTAPAYVMPPADVECGETPEAVA